MKRLTALTGALLILLSACGLPSAAEAGPLARSGGTQAPSALSAPIPLPASVPEELDLPLDPDSFPYELTTDFTGGEDPDQLYLMAQLPQADVRLYGFGDGERVVLQIGDRCTAYSLRYLTPRRYLPKLDWGDYDRDGQEELALLTYADSGTGVSVWALTIAEVDGEDWHLLTLQDCDYDAALSPSLSCSASAAQAVLTLGAHSISVPLPEGHAGKDTALTAYTGTITDFTIQRSSITISLAVGICGADIPFSTFYPADLEGQVLYDGAGFSLDCLSLTVGTE